MNDLYHSDISVKRWIVYDIFGNIGWIIYYVCVWKLLRPGLTLLSFLALVAAAMMLVGLVELISERIAKLDYTLPKIRLWRGFGLLALGGICGAVVAAVLLVVEPAPLPFWMLAGGVLCAVFSGLLFREYHPV